MNLAIEFDVSGVPTVKTDDTVWIEIGDVSVLVYRDNFNSGVVAVACPKGAESQGDLARFTVKDTEVKKWFDMREVQQ